MSTSSVFYFAITMAISILAASPTSSAAVVPLTFPSIAEFSILAGSGITNSGFSVVTGLIGTSPGTSITGQQITQTSGANAAVASTEKAAGAAQNMSTAYLSLAAQTCDTVMSGTDLGGLSLAPGVYCFAGEALLTGSLALTGPADGIFVFQIASKLTTSTSSAITGEAGTNVFWQVGSSATINALSAFKGTVIAYTSIALLDHATVNGRLMALNGAVTLIGNTISSLGTSLSTLSASPAVLYPAFTPTTTYYTVSPVAISNPFVRLLLLSLDLGLDLLRAHMFATLLCRTVLSTTSSVTIAATLNDASSSISGALGTQTLPFGAKNFTVIVTSQDGLHNTSYIIEVTRTAISSDATLSSLSVTSGTLVPSFSPSLLSYQVNVANAVATVSFASSTTAGSSSVSSNGLGPHDVVVGSNLFYFTVTAADTTTKNYTVNVIRASSSLSIDATLATLTISVGSLSPAFAASTHSYSCGFYDRAHYDRRNDKQFSCIHCPVVLGSRSLNFGPNVFTILVTAEDLTSTQSYTLTIERAAPSTDATLASLTASSTVFSTGFTSGVYLYQGAAPYSASSITVAATPSSAFATIAFTSLGVKSLTVGPSNLFSVVVTAQDQSTTKLYRLNITRASPAASTDSLLSALNISQAGVAVTMYPAFAPTTLLYNATVPASATTVRFSTATNFPGASVNLVGSGIEVACPTGSTNFSIVVTAQDEATQQTYTVNINRPQSSSGVSWFPSFVTIAGLFFFTRGLSAVM